VCFFFEHRGQPGAEGWGCRRLRPRAIFICGVVAPGRRSFGVVSRWLVAYSTACEAFGRLGIAAIKNSAKSQERQSLAFQFRRIRHARSPECLELAPTAAALWPLMGATENAAQNHDAKPLQRRDPGRNLHVGCAAQTVGPRRNCRDHVRWNPHANSAMRRARRCLFLARRPAPCRRVVGKAAA